MMNQQKLFETTEAEISEFRSFLEKNLNGRECLTLHGIMRNDPWGELAAYAQVDAENDELDDVSIDFINFSQSMKDSAGLWES